MIKQYTRVITNQADGVIVAAISQVLPFADNYDPITKGGMVTDTFDFELEIDEPDADFSDQVMLRGRAILENFEVVNGQPQLKPGADVGVKGKVLNIGATKSINATDVKAELAAAIVSELAKSGETEDDLLAALAATGRPVAALTDLPAVALIRIKKKLEAR